jgi:4-alpha-glucanotransferase
MDPSLERLARACGVATSYENWAHHPVEIPEQTVRKVLSGLGIDAQDPAAALADWHARAWQRVLPPTVVLRQQLNGGDTQQVSLRCAAGASVRAEIRAGAPDPELLAAPEIAEANDRDPASGRVERAVRIPSGLPLGDHRLIAFEGGQQVANVPAIVTPDRLPLPDGRLWGWMIQLYAVRNAWGMGDYADLAELAAWSADQGAGLLLVNPLHAVAPVAPVQNSPYYPASRRFNSVLYLRPERLPEYDRASADVRGRVDELAAGIAPTELIDRNAVWAAKSAALELLFDYAVSRPDAEDSSGLTDFATWCALIERHGADWRLWPQALQDSRSDAVRLARDDLADRVGYHRWLQHCCAEQLAAAQGAATARGMKVGVVHDLAVGVDPGGADAWALGADLATGFTVGAPPDSFNQRGQDWGLPPWRPDRLAETGYASFRDMVRAVLRTGGGLRIDHILGLFRLWWIPEGCSPEHGSYVSYDADALLGIIALEAERAGALVVGEDLGTVPPEVRTALRDRSVLGSAVLWFERADDGSLIPPEAWPASAMASITTHDLPTAAGFLRAEHVRIRAELGLLTDPAEEAQRAFRERQELLALLASEGLAAPGSPEVDVVLGMHALLARSPSRVVLASLSDAIGDLRQPNLPGTVDEYPNWRLPIADSAGREPSRAELLASPAVARLAALFNAAKPAAVFNAQLSAASPSASAGNSGAERE